MNSTVFIKGDKATYNGESRGTGESFIMPGDEVVVTYSECDYDSEVAVVNAEFADTCVPFYVSPEELTWLDCA